MNINNRGSGNTGVLKAIQEASKKISESNGISSMYQISENGNSMNTTPPEKLNISEESKNKINEMFGNNFQNSTTGVSNSGKMKIDFAKSAKDRLLDSIDSLGYTKEYFNAIQSLITLYAMDALDESVTDRMSNVDKREIKSILEEFINLI